MAWTGPNGGRSPPETEVLDTPAKYRAHVADNVQRAYEQGVRLQKKGDRYFIASTTLAFLSSATGFVTAALDVALVGVLTGILGAAGGAIASWVRRGHFDAQASAKRQLVHILQQELREFDAHVGAYSDVPELSVEANDQHRFQLLVDRSERASIVAADASEPSQTHAAS